MQSDPLVFTRALSFCPNKDSQLASVLEERRSTTIPSFRMGGILRASLLASCISDAKVLDASPLEINDLAQRIVGFVNAWRSQFIKESHVEMVLKEKEGGKSYRPMLIFSKKCKEGKQVKLGMNSCVWIGKGTNVQAMRFPVVNIRREKGDWKIWIKQKALLQIMAEKPRLRKGAIKYFELGAWSQRRAIESLKESGVDSTSIMPVPRRLKYTTGTYTQRYCPYNFARVMGKLNPREKLELLENIACAAAALNSRGIAHFDLRPDNILLSSDYKGHLNDFESSHEFGTEFPITTRNFPYRGMPFHKAAKEKLNFYVYQGVDVVGLACSIAEACLPGVDWNFPYGEVISKKSEKREKFLGKLDPLQTRLFALVEEVMLADKAFTDSVRGKELAKEEVLRKGDEIFAGINASWCAEELKKIRLEFFSK